MFPRLGQEIENCERADAAAVKLLRTSTEQLGHHTAHAICHGMVYVEYRHVHVLLGSHCLRLCDETIVLSLIIQARYPRRNCLTKTLICFAQLEPTVLRAMELGAT